MNEVNRVLVIDDDDLVLRTIGSVLRKQGYEYRLASSGADAIKYASEVDFDMILADIRMPVINGVDAVSQIQKSRKNANKNELPVIFITGFADESFHLKAESLGEVI